MRIGIVGLGVIAPYFLRAIGQVRTLRLTAVCDRDTAKLASYATADVVAATDYRELLDRGMVDALVVTVPNDLHFEIVSAALAAGIHVCCEKPLTIGSDEAERLCAISRRAGVTLFTAFHRRYNRHVLRLARDLPPQDQIASVICRYQENIGEHTGGESWYLDPARCGGGCLADNGPNAIDALRLLLGDLTIAGCTLSRVSGGAEFGACVSLRSAAGVPATVLLDWALPTGEVKDISIRLRDGSALAADMLDGFRGFKASLEHEYARVVTEFRRAVAGGREHGEDGAAVTALVEDAYALARTMDKGR